MTARMSFSTVPRVDVPSAAASRPVRQARRGTAPVPPAARRGFPVRPLAAALALGFAVPAAHALPQGAQVVRGSAQISQQGSHLQVTNTPGAVIHWQSFGIGAGQSVYFQQQNARSAVLNRVVGGSPSEILGTLGSNGRVFLINGAGIVFGKGAVIDTAGFTASTLNISDADWKAGRVRLQAEGVPGGIAITDVVQVHGDVYLVAPQITNTGAVKVENGHAVLAAGQSVAITGRGLEGIQLEVVNPGDQVLNLGSIEAGAVGLFAGTLKHSGAVQANALETVDGKVWLKAHDGVEVSGQVTARQGSLGGEIVVTGADTRVTASARLDASGARGGGAVYVGGGWQGQDPAIDNARTTRVEQGAQVRADAIEVGDGGTVVVWSDGQTSTLGHLSARGGAQGGNGGRVETSGKTLVRSGLPDVGAPQGRGGTWLLDPDQVLILPGSGSFNFSGQMDADDPGPTQIYQEEIESFSGVDIRIEARQGITASGWGSGSQLIISEGSSLTLRTTDASCPTTVACGIDLATSGPDQIVALSGSTSTSAGTITILAGVQNPAVPGQQSAQVRVNDIVTYGGDVTIRAAGNITVNSIETSGDNEFFNPALFNAGNVTVASENGAVDLGAVVAAGARADTPGRGGDILIEGRQQADGTPAVRIREGVASIGGDGDMDGNGADGGNIEVVLKGATNGDAGVLHLEDNGLFLPDYFPNYNRGGLHSIGGSAFEANPGAGDGGNGGNVTVRGADAGTDIRIVMEDRATITSRGGWPAVGSGSSGNAGSISIEGRNVTLDGGVYVGLRSDQPGADFAVGEGSDVSVQAGGDLTLTGDVELAAETLSLTAGGDIAGTAGAATPQLRSEVLALQAGGNITATMDTDVLLAASDSSGGTVRLTNTGSGTLSVWSGLNPGGDFVLDTAGVLEVRATSDGSRIQARNVTLTAQGGIGVIGQAANPQQPMAVTPGPAGSAAIVASNNLTLNANGPLWLIGGSTAAHVAGEHVAINATSLSLTGGTGNNAYAAIQYGSDLALGLPGGATLSFSPGSGANADAVIYTTASRPSFVAIDPSWICTPDCAPDFRHSTGGPLGDGVANRGLTQGLPAEETQADIPVIQVLVQLQRILESERFGEVALEAENVCR